MKALATSCGPRIATPLLVALLVLGCGARDVTATERPASAPAAATPRIPATVQGRWTPDSKALQAAGALTLNAQTLTWSPCGAAARAATAEQNGTTVLLSLPGQAACRLDGEPITHLRLQPAAGNACEMELSAYESAAHLARQERLAWGVYSRAGCTVGNAR